MDERPAPHELAAWRSFLEAHSRLTGILERELEAGRGLPLTWYDVLVQLSEAPGQQLRMHGLANAVLLSRAGLTRLVDRMAAAGLVERVACEQDRRGTFVHLTAQGEQTLREAAPIHLRGVAEHFVAPLTPADVAAIDAACRRLVRADRASAGCAPAADEEPAAAR